MTTATDRQQERGIEIGADMAAGGTLVSSAGTVPSGATEEKHASARIITPRPQLPLTDQELRARIQWAQRSSHHFQISYDRASFNEQRAALLNESLEIAYSLIFHFTHESFTDRFQIYAVDQRAPGLLGRVVWPHFSLEDRAIYLVESTTRPIHAELGSLLAHAMRISRYARHYRATSGWASLQEGFSIFLSERLSTHPDIYPFFGSEPDLIAHYLYNNGSRSLVEIWNSQPELLETKDRILTGAFMLYLGDTVGDDRVVSFSKSDDPITNETFRTFFNATLENLEAGWLQHFPVALVSMTEMERETMIQRWELAIESSCHRH